MSSFVEVEDQTEQIKTIDESGASKGKGVIKCAIAVALLFAAAAGLAIYFKLQRDSVVVSIFAENGSEDVCKG
jgi:TPP-dependent pyruvate/acetoin dehydrogenase alpha subunit